MRTKVQKWGNSLAVRIPKAFAEELRLGEEAAVELTLSEGHLVVSPQPVPSHSLKALLADVRDDNLHDEVETGGPVGRESW